MYISPKNSEKLQEKLYIKSLPAVRLYYGDLKLFSEFSFPFKQIKKINAEYEVADFLQRKLRRSIISETTQKQKLYKSLAKSHQIDQGVLVFILDSSLPVCDFELNSFFFQNDPESYKSISKEDKKKYIIAAQNVFITLSRILSPMPSYFIRNHSNFLSNLGTAFQGVDISSSFLQSSKKEVYSIYISQMFKSIEIENSSIAKPLTLCQGMYYFNHSMKSLHPISLYDLIGNPEDLISPIIRIKNKLQSSRKNVLHRYPYVNYKALFQNASPKFLFVNMDFVNSMMSPNTKSSLENTIKSLSNQNISNHLVHKINKKISSILMKMIPS
jgi:hypothetical protein